MFTKTKFNRTAIAVAMAVGMSTAAMAQETSSSISGKVVGPQGNAAAGTVVTITHVPSGTTKTVTVGNNGHYSAKGLRVGGPYTVSVDSEGFIDADYEGISLVLGKPLQFDVQLEDGQNIERIAVTASASSLLAFNNVRGPAANFSQEQIENAPAINRAITDIVRVDPRIYVSEGNDDGDTIQCAGKNRRFNSFTVDGVRMDDIFGLSDSGLPTNRFPFSFDALEQVSVELAPFDVIYGGFSACTINSVIKSGSNEFHGSVFYDYTDNDMRGDKIDGDEVTWPEYEEKRYGMTFGGPLIKDTLYFFAAYEKLEGADVYEGGVAGSGPRASTLTQTQLDDIISIAQDLYQFDPGTLPSDLEKGDEKFLVKLDWNISEDHRAALTYINSEDFNTNDDFFYDLQLSSNQWRSEKELASLSTSVYSDWSDDFSTEVRFTTLSVENDNRPLLGTDFAFFGIEHEGDRALGMGGDVFRQANRVEYDVDTISASGKYYLEDGSSISAGIEREMVSVFNVFGRYSQGEFVFDSIEDFRNGMPSSFRYENAATGDVNDIAGAWEYATNTLYAQYDFEPVDDLSMVVGLRYDVYDTSDVPDNNPFFEADYGYTNAQTLDGVDLLQPRFSLTYDLSDDVILRGGLGLYSGGNPAVWLTNSFVRTGGNTFGSRETGLADGQSLFDINHLGAEDGRPDGPGWGIPEAAYTDVGSNLGQFSPREDVNYLDPNFKMPSEWKLSIGSTHTLTDDITANFDVLLSKSNNALMVKRGDLDPVLDSSGNPVLTAEDGLPDYVSNRIESYVVTNADENAFSYILSAAVAGRHDNGIDWTLGYAYSDAEDVQGLVSSQATSNYQRTARNDAQNFVASTSNYNIEHRLTGTVTYSREFFSGLNTRFSAFAVYQSGEVFSLTESGSGTYGRRGTWGELTEDGLVLMPGAERNGEEGPSWTKVDVKITQDLPGFMEGHKASAFIVIDNFTNLLNDDWGVLEEQDGNYQFSEADDTPFVKRNASAYEIRVGVEYKF